MAAEEFWILTTRAIPRTTILKYTPGYKRFVLRHHVVFASVLCKNGNLFSPGANCHGFNNLKSTLFGLSSEVSRLTRRYCLFFQTG